MTPANKNRIRIFIRFIEACVKTDAPIQPPKELRRLGLRGTQINFPTDAGLPCTIISAPGSAKNLLGSFVVTEFEDVRLDILEQCGMHQDVSKVERLESFVMALRWLLEADPAEPLPMDDKQAAVEFSMPLDNGATVVVQLSDRVGPVGIGTVLISDSSKGHKVYDPAQL